MLYHCFATFKQSLLDFFKLLDSRLILIEKSEVERFGQCCVQDVPVRCLTEGQNYYPQCVR